MTESLGLLETTGWTPAAVALHTMEQSARIRFVQAELNDFLGICLKIRGQTAQVEQALSRGAAVAEAMEGRPVQVQLRRVHPDAWPALLSPPEFNPLIQQDVVTGPPVNGPPAYVDPTTTSSEAVAMGSPIPALGFIETQGFTAVFAAIDEACKAAGVEVVGKEKLGGGYVTVVIEGDVAAVQAAVAAGRQRVEGLGKLIAAHVLTAPSASVLQLLPARAPS